MFLNVEKALIQNKCLVMPQVYIRPEVDKNLREKVKSVINDHHGYITGNININIGTFIILLANVESIAS